MLFHRLPRSLRSEQSPVRTVLQSRPGRLLWIIALLMSLACLFGFANFPEELPVHCEVGLMVFQLSCAYRNITCHLSLML